MNAQKRAARLLERCIGLRTMRKLRRADPRFGSSLGKLTNKTANLCDVMSDRLLLRGGLKPEAIASVASEIVEHVREARALSLTGEIESILNARSDNTGVILRLGLGGEAPLTLQEAGQAIGISRERVRQKQVKVERSVRNVAPYTPVLDKLLRVLGEELGGRFRRTEEVEEAMWSAGRLSRRDRISQIVAFANLKGVGGFAIANCKGTAILGRSASLARFELFVEAVEVAVDEFTRDFGACSLDALRDRLEQEGFADTLSGLITALDCMGDELDWLEDQTWCRLHRTWNRYTNLAQKILSVSPRIRIAELRKGLQRNHRIQYVPPSQVLGRIIAAEIPNATFDGAFVEWKPKRAPEDVLSPSERALYAVLNEHGGVMARADFEASAFSAGIPRTSFYMYVQSSPIIDRLAKGVYGLRGVTVQSGIVESLALKATRRAGLDRDYGHMKDGRIWMAQELSKAAIGAGLLSRPSGLRDYVSDGTYRVRLDGTPTPYELKCSSNQLRFSRKMLSAYGAEPGDFALLVFDPGAGMLDVSFGDENVANKLLDSPEISEAAKV